MSTRRPLIAGNWKMNTSRAGAVALAAAVAAEPVHGVDLVVCPPYPWLIPVAEALAGSDVGLGAQDCWPQPSGALTGVVSIAMVAEVCRCVIAGHSERRQSFGESDALVRDKVSAIRAAALTAILCVGESLETRQSGGASEFVSAQVRAAIEGRDAAELAGCVIAYEPIWAIGTGVAATPADAEDMAAVIRETVERLSPGSGDALRILYGGSVNAANSGAMLNQPNVDGALVGGASLDAASFLSIARSVAT
jgi:triosephosphate isomerase